MNPETLKQAYESACNDYLKAFCEKQEMECGYWVGDIVGGIAYCSDFFFNFQDIVWDINSNQPKGRIIKWYDYSITAENPVNYYFFTKLNS